MGYLALNLKHRRLLKSIWTHRYERQG